MSPRQQFTSSPYALRSATTDSVADAAVGTGAIIDGAVTAAKLGITCSGGQVLMRSGTGWGCGIVSSSIGGAITGFVAGAGLIGGGTAGSVTMDVNFAGTGKAATVARSDHDHDAVYQKKYGKVATVAKSGGDHATPAAALASVATWCGTPSATNPCLVQIMPGIYDQGATFLAMLDFVDIEGSGETNSIITGSIDSTTAGVVNGANAALGSLTVKNTGGANAQNALALFNNATTFTVSRVAAVASGAVKSYALYAAGGVARVVQSSLDAGTTIFTASGAKASTFTTTFVNGTVINNGTLSCVSSRDGSNRFFAESCPPFQVLRVVDTQPNYNGNTLPSNTLIKTQFNNDINHVTITTSTFTVKDSMTGTYLNGTVQYDAGNRTAIFTPGVALSGYWVATITTSVRDISGGSLAQPHSWSWNMNGGTPDTKPPAVVNGTPTGMITGWMSTQIYANFDEPIDRLTSLAGLIKLVDATGTAVSGKVTAFGNNLYFTSDNPLSLGMTYTATVSGVKDLAGNTQAALYSWNFTTASVGTPSSLSATRGNLQATLT